MSNLSGYDSDVVGFDSVSLNRRSETTSSTQTTDFVESGVSCQTSVSRDCGSLATADELEAGDDILREYPPPGLNEFLRRVVPGMLAQLDEDAPHCSSDEEEEDMLVAKMDQEILLADAPGMGAGDEATCVLALSWSSAGSSLAVSAGRARHEAWCGHGGLLRVYSVRRAADGTLAHLLDVDEKNCVTAVRYHPSVAALLAYGTTSGEVVMCDLRNTSPSYTTLSSPSGCHGSKRVSALKWADAPLANTFLTMQINCKGKRRGASDQILMSSGSDGTINIWQVNFNTKTFESVVCYTVNGSRKMAAPDISCFDFIKSFPLRPSDERIADDIFVVGTKSGALFLCKIKSPLGMDGDVLDPVYDLLDGHQACVLDVAFSAQKPGIFVSVSIDSQLRVYDIHQASPLKVCDIEGSVSCVSWLPINPCICVVGVANGALLYNVCSGRRVPVEGLNHGAVTAIDVNQSGSCRIACGDADSKVRVWEIPVRRIRFSPDDLDF